MTNDFMIFTVASQYYGVNLQDIREIITYTHFTKIPDSRPWVVGMIETRGQPMPIIDLRIRFETKIEPTYNDKTVIVATKLANSRLLGLVVDSVEDIKSFKNEEILSSSEMDESLHSTLLSGYIQKDDYSILILNHKEFSVLNDTEHIVKPQIESNQL